MLWESVEAKAASRKNTGTQMQSLTPWYTGGGGLCVLPNHEWPHGRERGHFSWVTRGDPVQLGVGYYTRHDLALLCCDPTTWKKHKFGFTVSEVRVPVSLTVPVLGLQWGTTSEQKGRVERSCVSLGIREAERRVPKLESFLLLAILLHLGLQPINTTHI